MVCQVVKVGGSTAIVCSRDRKPRRRCVICRQPASKLCDYRKPGVKTCNAPLCNRCAVPVGDDVDHCPTHADGGQPDLFTAVGGSR